MNIARPTYQRLQPGEHCRLSEDQWGEALETNEAFHQWGSAFLVDDGAHVRAFLRDVSGEGKHTAWCFDAERSERAREGAVAVEKLAEVTGRLVSADVERGGSNSAQRAELDAASEAYVKAAEALYEELLRIERR